MAIIDSVKLPDNSTYEVADNHSGYAKKVAGATTDDLASLTATGDLADSGKKLSDLVLKSNVKDVLNSTSTTDPLSAKQGKVLADNLAANENVYGAKNENAYPYEDTTKADSGITFTDNGDGSITVSGTAGANTSFNCHHVTRLTLSTGKHKINGCPAGGSGAWYINITEFINGVYSDIYTVDENGLEITADNTKSYAVYVWVASGTVISTPITFYPMIRDSRVVDDTWTPYAPTNRELMSYKANGKVGAKNMLYYPYYDTTKTENGVTFTDNGDGSVTVVTVGGGATDNTYFFIKYAEPLNIEGMLKLSGCPLGGSGDTYYATLYYTYNGVYYGVLDTGSGGTFKIENSHLGTPCYMVIAVRTGTIINSAITFKPMIRIAEDTDPTYQPFAMTNKQLTDEVTIQKYTNGSLQLFKKGNQVTLNTNGRFSITSGTVYIPEGFRPTGYVFFPAWDNNGIALIQVTSDGKISVFETYPTPIDDGVLACATWYTL